MAKSLRYYRFAHLSMWMVFFFIGTLLASEPPDTIWTRYYGGQEFGQEDNGWSIQRTRDGGYAAFGKTESLGAGLSDFWLIRTDGYGDTLWTRTYGGTGWDDGYSARQTTDGGYILAGRTTSFGAGWGDVYLVKTDDVGDIVWTRTFGGSSDDFAFSVRQTEDEGYILVGGSSNDVYLVKTDAEGNAIWEKRYGGVLYDAGYSVEQVPDGGYIVGGETYLGYGTGGEEFYLIRTDANGDTLWTRHYGGPADDWGRCASWTSDGGYVFVGNTTSFGSGWGDIGLVKTDAFGEPLWMRVYGGDTIEQDNGYCVRQTSDGGYIIAGNTWSRGSGEADVYLIRANDSGDTLWTETIGGGFWDGAWSVERTPEGGYIVVGTTGSYGDPWGDFYLIRIRSDSPIGRSPSNGRRFYHAVSGSHLKACHRRYGVGALMETFLRESIGFVPAR